MDFARSLKKKRARAFSKKKAAHQKRVICRILSEIIIKKRGTPEGVHNNDRLLNPLTSITGFQVNRRERKKFI